MFVYILEI